VRTIIERELDERSSAQSLSIVKIACGLGISTGHLSRMFKRTTGVTLERYLMILRIESGKRLLLEPLANISDTAERCGFSDSAYFARVFRKIVGCSPKEYREDPMRFAAASQPDIFLATMQKDCVIP
jgi:AraC-like DNA-binding protein